MTEQRLEKLQRFTNTGLYPRLLLAEADPLAFLAGLMAACLSDCSLFIGNPGWRRSEWQQALSLIQPELIWQGGNAPSADIPHAAATREDQGGWLMIPTGGSAGKIRFTIHTWATLKAAVQGCQDHFFSEISAKAGSKRAINSCCLLPLYHVSGLMQFMRSLITGGQFLLLPKEALATGISEDQAIGAFLSTESLQPQSYFLSLVPTQLQRLLQAGKSIGVTISDRISWLAQFRAILLGGAPPWPALLHEAQQHQLPLALTYGMTETAAQVATLKPDQFLQGDHSNGRALPHAKISIRGDGAQSLAANQIGQVVVEGASVCLGYYPQPFAQPGVLETEDLGYMDEQGNLWIAGRSSRTIFTGGETVFPEEIEAALLATGHVTDVYVFGQADQEWGEQIVALLVPVSPAVTPALLKATLKDHLSPLKHPKQWIFLPQLPRTPQGKVSQPLVQQALGSDL
ncbi:MAG: 2-succinylbenzoate--CoA ligase [Acaryochloridaceae cyanobacterium SU_2_1]|nr:2-succinylbenzoate--CoA ligase [Acaryochloridaceae cyanobacterium SU_2_1]